MADAQPPQDQDDDQKGIRQSAAVAFLSRMPVLEYFNRVWAQKLAIVMIFVNLLSFALLFWYFGWHDSTTVYGVLPSEPADDSIHPPDYAPPALASLQDRWDVSVIETKLVYYNATGTFERFGQDYWAPAVFTCGCSDWRHPVPVDQCNLESCSGTIPIVVEYEQFNHWFEALILSTGALVYVNLAFTTIFAVLLFC
ncbi:unnamed protein product, partial [Ectocarpus fasciculatus]